MYLIPVHIVTEFYCRTVGVRHDNVHDFHSPVLLLYERIFNFVVGQYVTRNGRQLYKADDGKLYPSFSAAVQAGTEDSWRNLLGEGTVRAGELGKRSDYAAEQGRARGSRSFLPELGITEYVGQFLNDLGTLGKYNLGRQFGGAQERDPFASAPVVVPPPKKAVDDTATVPALPPGLDLSRPKPFAMTPEGQFDRYFNNPEMDQYFGASSRGKGAPKTAEAALDLASGKGVPEGTDIATKYRAESAMGRGNMDEIVEAMGYKGSPMEQWARANPMLAFREYNKKFPAGQPTIGPTPAALQASEGPMTAFGQEVKTFFPGAEPGADMDTARLEGEEIIDAVNFLKKRAGLQK